MSDSDSSSYEDVSSSEEEAATQKPTATTSKKAAPVIPFPFPKVRELIRKAAEAVENERAPAKLDWKKIIPTLEAEASNGGFPMDFFKDLWTLLAPSPSFTKAHKAKIITHTNRVQVVRLLVPSEPVGAELCRQMMKDTIAHVDKVTLDEEAYKTTNYDLKFANAVMEQLFGLTEYNLTAPGWMPSELFTEIFVFLNVPELCEWACVLLRQTAHAGLVKKVHGEICITNMKKLGNLKVKGVMMNLHFLYQMLKMLTPNLVPWSMPSLAFGNVRPRTTSKKLQDQLYKVLEQHSEEGVEWKGQGYANPQMIFKEFRPNNLRFTKSMVMNTNNVLSMNTAVWSLFEEGNSCLLNFRPDLLEMVDNFFLVVFRHKFLDVIPNLKTPSSRQQYLFILKSCRNVCIALVGKGLSSLDWWLPRFLITWDRDLWRQEIVNLVKFLHVGILQGNVGKQALNILGSDVGESTDELQSYQVWFALESLLLSWIESAPEFDPTDKSSADHHHAVDTLYKVMIKAMIDFIKDFVSQMERLSFVVKFMEFFVKIAKTCQQKKIIFLPMLPDSLFFAIFIADHVRAYEAFCAYMDLMKRISQRPDAKWKANDLNKLAEFNEGFKKFFAGEGQSPMLALMDKTISTMEPEDKEYFEKKVGCINYLGSPALCPYMLPNGKWNLDKLKKDAVHLAAFVHSFESGGESSQQGPKPKVKGCQKIAQANMERQTIRISNPADDKTAMFSFDAVFQEALQAEVYNEVARPLVVSVLEGYNATCTIFAYDQIGAGKTKKLNVEKHREQMINAAQDKFKVSKNFVANILQPRNESQEYLKASCAKNEDLLLVACI